MNTLLCKGSVKQSNQRFLYGCYVIEQLDIREIMSNNKIMQFSYLLKEQKIKQAGKETALFHGSFENKALENEDRRTKHPNLENEAPKTRNHCRFNKCNFTSYMTQSESGGGSGCVRTSKGPQNPSQGFITNCFTERF